MCRYLPDDAEHIQMLALVKRLSSLLTSLRRLRDYVQHVEVGGIKSGGIT
jgi:hypothetical protein